MGSQELPRRGRPEDSRLLLLANFRNIFEACGRLGILRALWVDSLQAQTTEDKDRQQRELPPGYMAILSGGVFERGGREHHIGVVSLLSLAPRTLVSYQVLRRSAGRASFAIDCYVQPQSSLPVSAEEALIYNAASDTLNHTDFRPDATDEVVEFFSGQYPGQPAIPTTEAFFRDAHEMVDLQTWAARKVREN